MNFDSKSKKCVGPVVAVSLLLVIAVISMVAFQSWFSGYQSYLFAQTDEKGSANAVNTQIENVIGSDLYFRNGYTSLTINDIKVDGTSCNLISSTYSSGLKQISLDDCLSNADDLTVEFVVITDKGIFTKNIYLNSLTLSSLFSALSNTVNNSNGFGTLDGDKFGSFVSVDGSYALIGAYDEDDAGGTASGKAYIINVETGNLIQTLDNPNSYNTSTNDQFGIVLSIGGNYAVVSSVLEDDAIANDAGKVYVFSILSGNMLYVLDNPNNDTTDGGDHFGSSVSTDGVNLIVGAEREDDVGNSSSGKAYIFDVSSGNLLHVLDNPNDYGTSFGDQFGSSVVIDGNYAMVGAELEDDAGGTESGKVYVFNVATGNLLYVIDNPNNYSTSAGDRFGTVVNMDGNYAIVSTPFEDDAAGTNSGKAYIFDVSSGNLLMVLDNPNNYSTGTFDYFGFSSDISGSYAVVGAYGEDDAGGTLSGKVYVFNVITGNLLRVIDNPNDYGTTQEDWFGSSVAMSGQNLVVGAYGEDAPGASLSGKVYIFN